VHRRFASTENFGNCDYAADDEVAAEPPPVAAPPRPATKAVPVPALLVSLLLRPVGCMRSSGIDGSFLMNLLAKIGPMIKARKMMNMKK